MQDIEAKERKNGILFAERMKKDNPAHGKYYCHHGKYIGSLKFLSNCQYCIIAVVNLMKALYPPPEKS